MKLDGKILVTVAMMLGATAAIGCNLPSKADSNAVAPEESAATAPVSTNSAAPDLEQDAIRFGVEFGGPRYYAPYGPPAVRVETYGRAPSARHFWAPGYWRWNGRQHVWIGGRWEVRRDGYEYMGPRWVNRYGRWEYVPGHWVRR